jgi:putative membrane protein
MMSGMGFGSGMWVFGWLWMLLFWGGLLLLAVWLVSLLFPTGKTQNRNKPASPPAEEILKTRYARGELTEEQYQEMLLTIQT